MRNTRILSLFLLLATFLIVPILWADSPTADAPQPDAQAVEDDNSTDARFAAALHADGENAEVDVLDLEGTLGAQNLGNCEVQSDTDYDCNCSLAFGQSLRRVVKERVCCPWGCGGWSTVSSSCTNNPC